MGTFSIWHWLVVLLVVALVFGTKKLRNIGGDLGAAVRGFKQGMKEEKTAIASDETESHDDTAASPTAKQTANEQSGREQS